MTARRWVGRILSATVALTVLMAPGTRLSGQQSGPFKVLIPAFMPAEGVSDRFGDRVADRLRDRINDLASHEALEERDTNNKAKELAQKEMKELECPYDAQGLASYLNVPVFICGRYTEVGDKMMELSVEIGATGAGSDGVTFKVPTITLHEDEQDQAADLIMEAFNTYNQQAIAAEGCRRYFQSSSWDDAIRNCTQTIEMNPDAVGALFTLAATYVELERFDEALEYVERVIEIDPVYSGALNLAGYAAAKTGASEKAQEYYSQYLQFDPGNVPVRLTVAYELAVEGEDPKGGMEIIADGLAIEPDNPELVQNYAQYAFFAARSMAEAEGTWAEGNLSADARELLETALEAYGKLISLDASAVTPDTWQNLVVSRMKLQDLEGAVQQADEAYRRNPRNVRFLDLKANVLTRMERHEEALRALDEARAINPDSVTRLHSRRAQRLMALGRTQEAVEAFQSAIERSEVDANAVGLQLMTMAYEEGITNKNYDEGLRLLEMAEGLDISQETKNRILFYKGFTLYSKGVATLGPAEDETVAEARAAKPFLQQAYTILSGLGSFTEGQTQAAAVASNAQTYVERADLIIRIGGGT